ncbi:MAG: hypothetical protein WBC70_08985 [Candidatus Aminicenantales bacterium]
MNRKAKGAPGIDAMNSQLETSIHDLPTINRFVLLIEPTTAFLEWARKFPDEYPTLTLDELLEDSSAYLIPEIDSNPDPWLEKNFRKIFEIELNDWCIDSSLWPKDLSFKTFKQFFNVRFCSIVIDMGEGSIKRILI